MEEVAGIRLVQKPVISHMLVQVGKSVTERINALDIEKQVATDDTIQTIKKLRTELGKELSEYEGQRKTLKNGVMDPYNEFESIYKSEISEKYKWADSILKDTIGKYEDMKRSEKRDNIFSYFSEACMSENIDFVSFEKLGLKFDLSTSEKKYREQVDEFISRVKQDLELISTQSHETEILVEYKSSLNVSQAITTVTERKRREKEEAQRKIDERTNKRTSALRDLGMYYSDLIKSFVYGESLSVKFSDIETMPDDDFKSECLSLKSVIEELKPKPETVSAPVSAPVVKESEKIYLVRFECNVTRKQAEALKSFLIENQITYQNI